MNTMDLLTKVYEISPIFLQNIMVSGKGIQNIRSRYGREYYKYRDFLKQFDNWSYEKKKEYQTEQLISLIKYANSNSLFYSKLYKDIDIGSINSLDDLTRLPIVTKEMLRENINKVTTQTKNTIDLHTGGTTGKSLSVKMTFDDHMRRMAMLDHFKSRFGFENLKMRKATFNGKHIIPNRQKSKVFWRYNLPCKQMIYSTFFLTDENIPFYIDSLNRFKPIEIDGFFSSVYDIASYLQRKGIHLKFTPLAIFTTSEMIDESKRKTIEDAFNAPLYDQYASSEGAPFITECTRHRKHIEMSSGIFESINDEAIVTSFTTYATPLIRYEIGDKIRLLKDKCECNICSDMVESIQGRTNDYLIATNGSKINLGNISNVVKVFPNSVIRAQFVQEEVKNIKVYVEVDTKRFPSKAVDIIVNEVKSKLGNDMNVEVIIVDKIVRNDSGKCPLIIRTVNQLSGIDK